MYDTVLDAATVEKHSKELLRLLPQLTYREIFPDDAALIYRFLPRAGWNNHCDFTVITTTDGPRVDNFALYTREIMQPPGTVFIIQ